MTWVHFRRPDDTVAPDIAVIIENIRTDIPSVELLPPKERVMIFIDWLKKHLEGAEDQGEKYDAVQACMSTLEKLYYGLEGTADVNFDFLLKDLGKYTNLLQQYQ